MRSHRPTWLVALLSIVCALSGIAPSGIERAARAAAPVVDAHVVPPNTLGITDAHGAERVARSHHRERRIDPALGSFDSAAGRALVLFGVLQPRHDAVGRAAAQRTTAPRGPPRPVLHS